MESLPALFGLAIVLFVSTNVDDLVVLVGFFAHPRFRARDVVAGQYAGLTVLFVLSAAGALLSLVIPNTYLGLLGIFPILIGIRKLVALRHDPVATEQTPGLNGSTTSYGNIGVYMPSFAVHSSGQIAIIAMVFVAMTATWCLLAHWMVNHPRLGAPLRHYGHIFAPIVLIGLGILILQHAGTISWLLRGMGR
jgi:cadmium resistance protein CadD (predicted permease)